MARYTNTISPISFTRYKLTLYYRKLENEMIFEINDVKSNFIIGVIKIIT